MKNLTNYALLCFGISVFGLVFAIAKLPGEALNPHDWASDRFKAYNKAHPCPPPKPVVEDPNASAFQNGFQSGLILSGCFPQAEIPLSIQGYFKLFGANEICVDFCLKHGDTRIIPCQKSETK
jgi:hypothetical protein